MTKREGIVKLLAATPVTMHALAVLVSLSFLSVAGVKADQLPEHVVASDKRIGLAHSTARRVELHVAGDTSKEQCIALLKAYADRAGPNGQVSVRKPSEKWGGMAPWCVDNRDGSPVIFNDSLF